MPFQSRRRSPLASPLPPPCHPADSQAFSKTSAPAVERSAVSSGSGKPKHTASASWGGDDGDGSSVCIPTSKAMDGLYYLYYLYYPYLTVHTMLYCTFSFVRSYSRSYLTYLTRLGVPIRIRGNERQRSCSTLLYIPSHQEPTKSLPRQTRAHHTHHDHYALSFPRTLLPKQVL